MHARGDPDVAALIEQGDANRLSGTTELAEHWAQQQALRPGLQVEEAAHALWLLTSVEQYLLATDRLGWSPETYERWLASLAHRAIMGAGSDATP